jgi:hypothetical protein
MSTTTNEEEEGKNYSSAIAVNSQFPEKKNVFMVAVPKYHENLFKHINDHHEWLADTEIFDVKARTSGKITHWRRKIISKEDKNKLNDLINKLKLEKSELFIDPEYFPKPHHVSTKSFINEFIKSKGIANHYTFTTYYRVTVFPEGVDPKVYPLIGINPETKESIIDSDDKRQEYLIIPLLVRLKRGKTLNQNKAIEYTSKNEDGTWNYEIKNISQVCFKRDDMVLLADEGVNEETQESTE